MTAAKKSLAAKLAEVMGLLDAPIAKKGVNTAQHYSFVNESDVSAAIRPLLAERNIWLWSSEVEQEIIPLFTTSSGTQMWLTRVKMAYQFIDGDSDERTEVQVYSGQGADTGDKSLPKAQSMALKYFLLKSFMLSTGKDDAESDTSVDKAAAGAAARSGSRIKGGKAQAGTQKGGKTEASTDAQKAEVKRLIKAKGMTPVTLLIAVSEALDVPASPGADPKDVLAALSAEEMGKLITYISEMVGIVDEDVEEVGTEEPPAAEDGEQEALDIV
jgi:hypothetical protein